MNLQSLRAAFQEMLQLYDKVQCGIKKCDKLKAHDVIASWEGITNSSILARSPTYCWNYWPLKFTVVIIIKMAANNLLMMYRYSIEEHCQGVVFNLPTEPA